MLRTCACLLASSQTVHRLSARRSPLGCTLRAERSSQWFTQCGGTQMRMTRRRLLALSPGAAVAGLAGCRRAGMTDAGTSAQPAAGMRAAPPAVASRQAGEGTVGRSVQTMTVDGLYRQYIRVEPPGLDRWTPVPFVMLLHGATSS